jgi:hypothetical protein
MAPTTDNPKRPPAGGQVKIDANRDLHLWARICAEAARRGMTSRTELCRTLIGERLAYLEGKLDDLAG